MKLIPKGTFALKSLFYVGIGCLGFYVLFQCVGLYNNASQSLPHLAYLVIKGKEAKVGDYVSFRNDWYNAVLTKKVVGKAGDQIAYKEDVLYVGNYKVGKVLTRSKQGRPLTPVQVGKVPEGTVFVATEHPRSFDSRYQEVGFIPIKDLIGVAYPICMGGCQ
jgi:conjugal transfer pilin signal peptidase TrbI